MSRSARELLQSLSNEDIRELDVVITAACMAEAWGKNPRHVFKKAKTNYSGKLKRMLTSFQKATNLRMLLDNHSTILERQYDGRI